MPLLGGYHGHFADPNGAIWAADEELRATNTVGQWPPGLLPIRPAKGRLAAAGEGYPGIPSRVRLSRDDSLAATTNLVSGDSYTNPGQFSTRTFISKADGRSVGELDSFRLIVDGRKLTRADRNFWGSRWPTTTTSTPPRPLLKPHGW